jgi:hypothetical protein
LSLIAISQRQSLHADFHGGKYELELHFNPCEQNIEIHENVRKFHRKAAIKQINNKEGKQAVSLCRGVVSQVQKFIL